MLKCSYFMGSCFWILNLKTQSKDWVLSTTKQYSFSGCMNLAFINYSPNQHSSKRGSNSLDGSCAVTNFLEDFFFHIEPWLESYQILLLTITSLITLNWFIAVSCCKYLVKGIITFPGRWLDLKNYVRRCSCSLSTRLI